ncbi:hypothetical protein M422DRAFT_166079 [Sphaerobolus stellatus SS14]|uniref:HTH CENPB-type domain-containing protein n=1 Tax=Sphaerobolus stellatus (strain SS14) TaxID=990650 RepID=A0A0C9W3N5_SPHS4|nr:hypothetical protein M422DRAFT_166079 [Sphaerobolus stellatus SS14]
MKKAQKDALGDATQRVINEDEEVEARELKIKEVMTAVCMGRVCSVNAVATRYGIPTSTLAYRLDGHASYREGHIKQQILNPAQIHILIDWCRTAGDKEIAWTRLEFRQKVFDMSGCKPSDKWVTHFLERHLEVSAYCPRPLDPKRARAFNPTTVNAYFDLLEDVIARYEVPVENISNTDEKGVQLGGGRKASNVKRLFATESKNQYILKADSLLLCTIIEAICADGTPVPSSIIMPPGATGDWIDVDGLGGSVLNFVFYFFCFAFLNI